MKATYPSRNRQRMHTQRMHTYNISTYFLRWQLNGKCCHSRLLHFLLALHRYHTLLFLCFYVCKHTVCAHLFFSLPSLSLMWLWQTLMCRFTMEKMCLSVLACVYQLRRLQRRKFICLLCVNQFLSSSSSTPKSTFSYFLSCDRCYCSYLHFAFYFKPFAVCVCVSPQPYHHHLFYFAFLLPLPPSFRERERERKSLRLLRFSPFFHFSHFILLLLFRHVFLFL